jgi:hypothetical protein
MNQAYDLACRTLQNIGQLEVDREIIARGILQAAGSGERDANKLCERAIHGLTALDYRQLVDRYSRCNSPASPHDRLSYGTVARKIPC